MVPAIQHFHVFLAVCEEGGFGAAARRLHITQPAVSYRISELERLLGVEVFERPRRPLILTAAGRELLSVCKGTLTELQRRVRGLPDGGAHADEPIRIAASGAIGRFVLFPILLRPAFRSLPYRLLFRHPDEILRLVETGASDLGFVYETRATTSLQFHEACREEFVLVRAPDLPLPGEDIDALASAPFVTYEECDYVFGRWFDAVFGAQPTGIRSASHFDRLEEVLAMTRLGRGLTVVPDHAVRDDLAAGRLVRVDVEGRRCLNPDYLVTRPGYRMRPEVEAILAALSREG